jgi:hypothetical protein
MSFLPSQGVSPSSLFGVCTMKLLGLGSDLSGGKVTRILKNLVEISYQDGTIEFISFDEAERRVWARV